MRTIVLFLCISGASLVCGPAFADGGSDVSNTDTGFVAEVMEYQHGSRNPGVRHADDPIVATFTEPQCFIGGSETCAEPALCDNGDPMTFTTYVTEGGVVVNGGDNCPTSEAVAALPNVTPGLVLSALRRIGLPESDLQIQPPGGRTLVNFDTNFYTDNAEFTRTVTLLGRHVELRIWPARFGWRFGDGASRWSESPGAAYPDLEITHRYRSKGRVAPSVDTTYAAQFRVEGGPWRDVAGTVTIPGRPEGLRVVTARPVLVGS
jgi:hypothetical protein